MCRAAVFLLAMTTLAQEAKFSSEVRVVTLLATVRDRDGRVIGNLTKENFRLEEDGRKKPIQYFSRESDVPLTMVLLVDTSRSMQRVFETERVASNQFLKQVLREDRDVAAVVHFDVKVGVLQDFTASREQLAEALTKLRIPARPATLLYDGIRDASEHMMRKRTGRKAFILLSDGADFRSETSLTNAIEYAQRADAMIYSILFAHRPNRALGKGGHGIVAKVMERGRKVMQRLAAETGGGFFEVTAQQPIDKIYAQIEDELRHQYSIGYTPSAKVADAAYRKIKLTTDRKGLVVRTRDGYYPQ